MPSPRLRHGLKTCVFLSMSFVILQGGSCSTEIDLENLDPEASIETSTEVSTGLPTRLDGTGSTDPEGEELDYEWDLISAPAGSSASLADPGAGLSTFTPDVSGDYVVRLTVRDPNLNQTTRTVTITASDNSAAATVDDTGGEVVSSDGRLRIVVPAGALANSTEIVITVAAPSQYPDPLFGLDLDLDMEVFDVQPEGQIFSIPALAEIDLEGAFSFAGGSLTGSSGFMIRLADGSIEPLLGPAITPDLTDPTTGVLSGGLDELAPVIVLGGLEPGSRGAVVSASPPDQVPAGTDFDIQVQAYYDYGDFPPLDPDTELLGATAIDGSVSPVEPDPAGVTFNPVSFSAAPFGYEAILDYVCATPGTGQWRSEVTLDIWHTTLELPFDDLPRSASWSSPLTFDLRWPIDCIAPPPTLERSVSRATWISPGVAGDEILVGGTDPERWYVTGGGVTSLGGFFGSEAVHFLHPIGSGLYANTVIGKSWSWNAVDDWQLIVPPVNDHALQFSLGEDGTLYGASGLRTPRTVSPSFELNEYAYSYVQAYWSDGTDHVLILTGGDGNAASNPSFAALADVPSGSPAVQLSGVMDETLDVWQVLARGLDCVRLPSDANQLVCVFTGGETSPGFLVNNQPQRDGYYEIFSVDVSTNAASSLESDRTAMVGAMAFERAGRTFLAFANQEGNSVEIREVDGTGVIDAQSISVAPSCTYIFDFTVTSAGDHAVASCWGEDGAGGADDKYVAVELTYP